MPEIKSSCCYCGVGCGVIIETGVVQGRTHIVNVRGDPDHPANFGRLCTKGSTLHLSATPETGILRARHPALRAHRGAALAPVSWSDALDHAATRFADTIARHGPDSVAFYISGQLLTEDYYLFNKLAKGLIGTNNIDSNSRLCMSSAVAGYKATLGVDAPPCSYEDIAETDCLLIAGSNMAYAHPVLFRRIEDARQANPNLKLIVVDPRRTDTAEAADLHLPILPGSDIALYNAMLHVLLWEGLVDMNYIHQHTEGFDALKEVLREYTPGMAAEVCGLGEHGADDIVKAAKMFGGSPRALSFYCQGLNQSAHGTHNNAALIHLHLATGKIGKPGCGPFSLTGQPNAMGGREVGGMANLLSGHRDLSNPSHRNEVARLWGVDRVPDKPGKTAVELFDALRRGEIKAVWIVGANPAQSLPDLNAVHTALRAAEFVVVQDAYADTDTTAFADVLLPASSWGEKEGTTTNSERRISHVLPAVAPPGEARADWQIAADFSLRLGARLGKEAQAKRMFAYDHVERVFDEHRETTRGRDLDITGLSYALLDALGPQQWPFPEGATTGQVRLYENGVFPTASGRASFVNTAHPRQNATAETIDARYPLRLTTGRLRDQWHGMSRTGTVARLFAHQPEPLLKLHVQDMERRRLKDGDLVRVASRRGELTVRVQASGSVRPGLAFMAMHWGGQFMSGLGVNALTISAFDPVSKQPELKHAAIQIEKLEATERQYEIVALRRAAPGESASLIMALRARLQPWLSRFEYATLTLAGRDDPVLVLRAFGAMPDASMLAALDADLGFDAESALPHTLSFNDPKRNIMKRALIENGVLTGVRLAGETAARDWLTDLMARGASTQAVRQWLLAPLTQPPLGEKPRGKVVCNCFDVAEEDIRVDLVAGLSLSALQEKRKCGTSCGSCLPELKKLVVLAQTVTATATSAAAAAAA